MSKPPRGKHRYSIRIIGGRWRGRRLVIPPDTEVRPTPDRVRETVFNWLSGSLVRACCLDLYAGTGALGLEALSRGAREAAFVERDAVLAEALRARVHDLQAEAQVVQTDVRAYLAKPPSRQFDVVFLDAPYSVAIEPILAALGPWLADGAHIYIERPQAGPAPTDLDALAGQLPGATVRKRSRAGGVAFGLLQLRRP